MAFVRVRLPWDEMQPEQQQWRWEVADRAIEAAGETGIQVVLLLDGAPAWAVNPIDADNPLAPPHDVRDFGQFAAAVAERYAGQIAAYQIWDEPNIAPHWGARWVSPQDYLELLREGANSIHRFDPDAPILLAQLAPTIADDGNNLSDLAFLDRLYTLGAAEFFDIVAGTAYGFDQPPDAPPAPDQLNFRRPELLYEIMQRHGDGDTPVWITAWGWWSLPEGDSPWEAVDAALLPDYIEQGLRLARVQWPWAGPMAWAEYSLNPEEDPLRLGFVQRLPDGARERPRAKPWRMTPGHHPPSALAPTQPPARPSATNRTPGASARTPPTPTRLASKR